MNCPNCSTEIKPQTRFCPGCGANVELAAAANLISDQDPKIAAFEKALGYKYKILRKLGSGGFADVYLGEHTQLGRNVAIKILRGADDPETIERFRREARAAAKLSHPNIIDIYDVGDSGSIYYFVMKHIPGDTLAQKMRRERKIPPANAIEIIKQLVDALAYAHDRGVVHRDIKPANALLDEFGKPVLMDFGIARMAFVGQLTRTGTLMGTPHYLPPEQPLGKPVDGRSDLYSLGIMFYEMLAGKVPFHDDAAIALIYKHINEQPPPLKSVTPELDPQLTAIVHKMIEKLPENRFQSAHDLYEALEALAEIYPTKMTPTRRSTPGGARDTERLFLLAEEHHQQRKLVQAMEIYGTILQRDPENKQAAQKRETITGLLFQSIADHSNQHDLVSARNVLNDLRHLIPSDPRIAEVSAELEREEQNFSKQKEFRTHFESAQLALKHDNAGSAVEHLTKALTIDPTSDEARTLLRDARASYEKNKRKAEFENAFGEAEYHYSQGSFDEALTAVHKALKLEQTTQATLLEERIQAALKEKAYRDAEERNIIQEVDHLCEQLSFSDAMKLLSSVRNDSPKLVKTLLPKVERNQDIYQKFLDSQDLLEQGKFPDAKKTIDEFLAFPTPYEFQAFYALRKQAEEAQKNISIQVAEEEFEQMLKKADTFLRLGQLNQAKEICRAILAQNPQHSAARSKFEDIERQMKSKEMQIDTGEFLKQLGQTSIRPPDTQPQMPSPQFPPKSQEIKIPVPTVTQPAPSPPVQAPAPAIPPARPAPAPAAKPVPATQKALTESVAISPFLKWGLGAAAGLILLFLSFLIFWSPEGKTTDIPLKDVPVKDVKVNPVDDTTPVPAPQEVTISIDVSPWAEIEITGGGLTGPLKQVTPARFNLIPGRYSLVARNPGFSNFNQTINVDGIHRDFRFSFQQLDPHSIADALVK